MTATCHKLTAGDGYEYLTRQVAVHDATDKGRTALVDYYHAKGEAPGRWVGSGLAVLHTPTGRDLTEQQMRDWIVEEGSEVTAGQMRSLFGDGLHPNAEKIATKAVAAGTHPSVAKTIGRLGRPFPIYTGASDYRKACAEAFGAYNERIGRPVDAAVDPAVRARIRTDVAVAMFTDTYRRGPDRRELAGFVAKHSRPATKAVAGNDVCFTPVKSASVLWAIAPTPVRELIERAHEQAWRDALDSAERNAVFSRMGAGGVQQVDTDGLIATAFVHRDSREGDPNLHTHVAISNKVRAVGPDGIPRWLAIDGRPFYKSVVAMSETYNSRFEAYMIDYLGVEFAERPTNTGKRPVREIVGVSPELIEFWSKRAKMIDARLDELMITFQREVGREPTAAEAYDLSQRATLETRNAKKAPRSFAEQRHAWHRQALGVLGSERALAAMLTTVVSRVRRTTHTAILDDWVDENAGRLVATMAQTRAKWQWAHVHAEAWRIARAEGLAHHRDIADRLTVAALDRCRVVATSALDGQMNEPQFLRRRSGASVYTTHATTMYTSAAILAAEKRLLAAATATGARSVDQRSIDMALLEHAANNNFTLNAGQAAMVRALAASSARVRLALAPAGTGKTAAMNVLARAWTDSGGTVVGLAPSASAAKVLGDDTGSVSDTLAKYVYCVNNPDKPTPAWFDNLDRDTLIVVDEAGMAGTLDLDTLLAHAQARDAAVVFIGDDQQLASISAGGVLRDIAHETGAVTLSSLVRFHDPAEGAAGLALRAGDTAGIGFYIDHNRVHIGSDAAAAEMAYHAWRADNTAGLATIMLAATTDTVTELNQRAQADRITGHRPAGRGAALCDGTHAYAGDIVFTSKNARWLPISRTDHVRNRYRWTVQTAHRDGSLTVQLITTNDKPGRTMRLPADYVAAHVRLGYAATVHAAQGLTVSTCHLVGSAMLTRQLLYVAMTRGRRTNHIYFSTAEHDPHKIISRAAVVPDTAVDVLTSILGRDGAQQSATTAARDGIDPFARLAHTVAAYSDAVGSCAQHQLGPHTMATIDHGAETLLTDLTEQPAWPALRKQLAIITVDTGSAQDTLSQLETTINERELDTADDTAAVLHWRIHPRLGGGPLPWLPTIPDALSNRQTEYLHTRAQRVAELAQAIETTAHAWTAATAPRWARALHAVNPELTARIAVFRAAHGVDDADRRISGPDQYPVATRRHQHQLITAAHTALHSEPTAQSRWLTHIQQIEPRIAADPYWPCLAEQLDAADRAGLNTTQLLTKAAGNRPLPDDMPAAALWWRLTRELTPATVSTGHSYQRPAWTPHLYRLLGSTLAEDTLADPAWPALVAAVEAADPKHWQPDQLLDAAHDLLVSGAHGNHVRPNEWAQALTWRVGLLLDPPTHILADIHPDTEPPITPEQHEQLAAQQPDPHQQSPHSTEPGFPPHDPDNDAYRASFDTLVPPPDHDATAPEQTPDLLGALDFDDLSPHRPDHHIPDLLTLWETEHNLQQQLDTLNQAHNDPSHWATPHLAALQTRYRQLLAEHRRQAPHHQAVTTAYQQWLAADRALQDAQTAADHATRTSTDDPNTPPDHVHHARAALLAAQTHEQHARRHLESTRQQLHTFLNGSPPITDELLDQLVDDAARADTALIADTQSRLQRTQTRIRATERAAAEEHARQHRTDIPDQLTQIRLEYTLLEDAAFRSARTPRLNPSTHRLTDTQAAAAATIARTPYTLNILTGTHTDTSPVLGALHNSAAAQQRPLLITTHTDAARHTAHTQQLSTQIHLASQLDHTSIDHAVILVPDAETWPLADLHNLAATCRTKTAKLILAGNIENPCATPQFRALAAELPWTQTLTHHPLLTAASSHLNTALHRLQDRGHLTINPSTHQLIEAATAAYHTDIAAGRDTVIIASPAQVATINTTLHHATPKTRTPIGWHHLAGGDIITTTTPTTSDNHHTPAGTRWTILTVNPHTRTAHAAQLANPHITTTIDDDTPIELGYAQTAATHTNCPTAHTHILITTTTDRATLAAADDTSHLYIHADTPNRAEQTINHAAARDLRPELTIDTTERAAHHAISTNHHLNNHQKIAIRLTSNRDTIRANHNNDYQKWQRQQITAARNRSQHRDHNKHTDATDQRVTARRSNSQPGLSL